MAELTHLRERVAARRALPSPAACRAIREAAGIGLRELAREIEVDATTLSRWERGLSVPGRRDKARGLLERYVAALDVLRGGDRG